MTCKAAHVRFPRLVRMWHVSPHRSIAGLPGSWDPISNPQGQTNVQTQVPWLHKHAPPLISRIVPGQFQQVGIFGDESETLLQCAEFRQDSPNCSFSKPRLCLRYKTDSEVEDCHMIPQWCSLANEANRAQQAEVGKCWWAFVVFVSKFVRASAELKLQKAHGFELGTWLQTPLHFTFTCFSHGSKV